MTDNNHPITPPPEFLRRLSEEAPRCRDQVVMTTEEWVAREVAREEWIATQAARWGADQELEACVEYIAGPGKWFANPEHRVSDLRAARRPEPPSLKEQALAELELLRGDANAHGLGFDAPAIRRALESLPE